MFVTFRFGQLFQRLFVVPERDVYARLVVDEFVHLVAEFGRRVDGVRLGDGQPRDHRRQVRLALVFVVIRRVLD